MDGELKKIKKVYGEDFAKLCRELFPEILQEEDGLILRVLKEKFEPNFDLYNEVKEKVDRFQYFIYNEAKKVKEDIKCSIKKVPQYSFEEFILYPEDGFTTDEKEKYYLYNNKIDNVFYCPGNIIIKNGKVTKIDKDRYEMWEYFVYDKQNRKIRSLVDDPSLENSFVDEFKNLKNIEFIEQENSRKVIVYKNDGNQFSFVLDNRNRIIEYHNSYIEEIKDNFLKYNRELKVLDLPNVKKVGNCCIALNQQLHELNLEKVEEIGNQFACFNFKLESLNLPNVRVIGNYVLDGKFSLGEIKDLGIYMIISSRIKSVFLPKVEKIGNYFSVGNSKELNCPNLKYIGNDFSGSSLEKLLLENLEYVGDDFIPYNYDLKELSLPNVIIVGKNFCYGNTDLKVLNMPKLKQVGDYFLKCNKTIKHLRLESLEKAGNGFFAENRVLKDYYMPNLNEMGDNSVFTNKVKDGFIKKMFKNIFINKEMLEEIRKELEEDDGFLEITIGEDDDELTK